MIIEIEGLSKNYGNAVALKSINLRIEAGGVVGILGPNGAGKTTLVEILEGLRAATSGRVSVLGMDPARQARALRELIGVQLQATNFIEELTPLETLKLFAAFFKKSLPPGEVLERVKLADRATSRNSNLSGGQRQRLAIAMALINDPELIILDEPTSGLDPKQIIEIRQLLKSLAGEHTIILSTHILTEVEQSCERVIIISQGKLVAIDSVQNLTNRLRGSEAVAVEIEAADGHPSAAEIQQRLESVSGVSRVLAKDVRDGRLHFEVESLSGRHIRADLARTVVNSGWALTEMRAVGLSLEDIFLQLTAAEKAAEKKDQPKQEGEQQ